MPGPLYNENLPEIFCEASDLVRLPPIVTDSCTEQVLRNGSSLEDVKVKLESLGLGVSNLSAKLVSIESQIAALPCGGAIAGNGGSSHPSSSSSHPPNPKASNKSSVDLRENLIVFGIKESRVLSDTMASVKNMLEFLTGRSTPVKDMYRIYLYSTKTHCSQALLTLGSSPCPSKQIQSQRV